ncbi:MAG: 50S ribosomal protein L17 [Bacilli bacterium]
MAERKLGRTSNKRRAMLRALTTDLFIYGRIQTTEMRAKEVRRIADKLITLGKKQDLHSRRLAASFLLNKVADVNVVEADINVFEKVTGEDGFKVKKHVGTAKKEVKVEQTALQKLFDEIAPSYATRNGGYTRVIKCVPRRGDNAKMAIIELV